MKSVISEMNLNFIEISDNYIESFPIKHHQIN